jgi:predicted methyltransferase
VKRDAYRHPAQTLSFFGVAPGQTVIEITPGWWLVLGNSGTDATHDKGHYYVAAVVDPHGGGRRPRA